MSVIWIWFIAKILMNVLNSLGLIFKVDDSFLALTLLSFGNSAPGKEYYFIMIKN